jgi:CBS domain-containing protein
VNVVIAGLLYLVLGGFPTLAGAEVQNPGIDILARLASVNLFLVLFNLIPAFPMDGGRVLRALLAYRMGFVRATQVAASVGQGLAFLFGLVGLFGNPLLLFIALFVYLGAAAEAHGVQMREVARGMIVSDAMITEFVNLSPTSHLADAMRELIRTTQHEFPIVDGAGRLRGILTRDAMIHALQERGSDVPVVDIMTRDIPLVHPRQSLDEAMRLLQDYDVPAVGVTDDSGQFTGYITPENLGEVMMMHAAQPKRPPGGMPPQRTSESPWVQPN